VDVRQSAVKRGEPSDYTQQKLVEWRTMAWKRDYPGALFGSAAIMSDETVVFLSSVGRLSDREHLSNVLAHQWKWEECYGNELYSLLSTADIPLKKPLAQKTQGTKQSGGEESPQTFQPIQTQTMGATSTARAESSSQVRKRAKTARTDSDQVPALHEAGAYYVPSMAQHRNPPYTPNQLYSTIPPQAYDPRHWFPFTATINPYFAPAAPNPLTFQFHNTFADSNTPPN